jgi:hypothetical protein
MPTPSILIIPDRYKAAVLYSQIPDSGAVDFDVTRATTAYRTNASGILESVASGVPRLDYPALGGCPSLLVEPAATNLVLRSEEFDNVAWTADQIIATANSQAAPNGATTADVLVATLSSGRHDANQLFSATSGTTYTTSCFVKKGTTRYAYLEGSSAALTFLVVYDFDTNAFTTQTGATATVVSYASGWVRIAATATATATAAIRVRFGQTSSSTSSSSALIITDNIIVWGAQLETGSVATSYIPTVAATATRNADVISKTGVSGFIGQASGTIYSEVDVRSIVSLKAIYQIDNGTGDNRLLLQISSPNVLTFFTTNGGLISAIASGTISTGIHKIGVGYSSANVSIFLDGAFLASGTTSNYPTLPLTNISLGSRIFSAVQGSFVNDRIRAAAIYTTRLDNAQLSALTTL